MSKFQNDHVARVSVEELGLLDMNVDAAFDRVTNLVCASFDVPVSLLSVIDADQDRQFFKSCIGLPEPWGTKRETPLSHSFCQYVVVTGSALIVEDAREDEDLSCNLAIENLGVIAYAGVPVHGPDEEPFAALCAIASEPRKWSANEVETLYCLANGISAEIRLRAALKAGEMLLMQPDRLAS